MDCLEDHFRKHPNIVARKICDEIILVPIKENIGDLEDSIYSLKGQVSNRIWDLIDGKRTGRETGKKICEEFEVSAQQAQDDLREFLAQLEKIGAIEKVKG